MKKYFDQEPFMLLAHAVQNEMLLNLFVVDEKEISEGHDHSLDHISRQHNDDFDAVCLTQDESSEKHQDDVNNVSNLQVCTLQLSTLCFMYSKSEDECAFAVCLS